MTKEYLEDHAETSNLVESTDGDTNSPVMDGDRFANNAPVEETLTQKTPISETGPQEASAGTTAGSLAALLNFEDSEHLRTHWNEIQAKFVDEPRSSVQQADALVSEVVEKITQMFAQEHGSLESQWNQGSDVSTEELRKALQHYRSFFNRLVV